MPETLILVDFESVQTFDISKLDDSYRGVIFVGAKQAPPKAARKPATAHRFARVDFMQIAGSGKNALDFHIAFHLGRLFETAPATVCIVLSKDKGYQPLLDHLNKSGMNCRRVGSLDELIAAPQPVAPEEPRATPPVPIPIASDPIALKPSTEVAASSSDERTVCRRCKKASTIEHHGGRWCTNCGTFATPPDPAQLPSTQLDLQRAQSRSGPFRRLVERQHRSANLPQCGWCHQRTEMGDGIYDDGEWMCGGCVAGCAR